MNEQDLINDVGTEVYHRINRQLRSANRFDNYREIRAKFNSTGACGHEIVKGDVIGWNKGYGCQCSNCWSKWVSENREADMVEQ
jgi:hypothetical protein